MRRDGLSHILMRHILFTAVILLQKPGLILNTTKTGLKKPVSEGLTIDYFTCWLGTGIYK